MLHSMLQMIIIYFETLYINQLKEIKLYIFLCFYLKYFSYLYINTNVSREPIIIKLIHQTYKPFTKENKFCIHK